VWLYRMCPMAPVADARTPAEGLVAGVPLLALGEELGETVTVRMARRSLVKANYRDIHILLVNIPALYKPPKDNALAGYLAASFADEMIDRRILVVGVRLRDKVGGGGGLSDAVDSVVQTLSTGTTPMSDFDADYATIDAIMSRSGMHAMTGDDFRLANAWWNWGQAPDTPMLVHSDHLHIFGSADSARAAASLDETDCVAWPKLSSHHTISLGCVQDFDLPYVPDESVAAQWATSLVDAGAVVVSIRGKLEPASVTRGELRRNKKKFIDDVRERAAQGKMERAEQEELLSEIAEVESVYATGGPATLIDCSTMVVFAGRDPRTGYDLSEMCRGSGLVLNSMVSRQNTALAETWLASPVRANPYLHDLPIHAVSSSGIAGLSMVGDTTGALLGFTERDRQPAYISPTAAADEDSVPLFIGVGASGSGKDLKLSTPIPTPSGWTTMGELHVGDEVFGSDGRPCRVTFVSPVETPVLYDIHFSDGQVVTACKDHQWLVSNWQDRNKVRHPHRVAAVENWDAAQQLVDELIHLASLFDDADMLTADELMSAMSHLDMSWKTPFGVSTALDFVDCPSEMDYREIVITSAETQRTKTDPVVLFPVVAALQACREKWLHPGAANAARWGQAHFDEYVAAADALIAVTDPDEEATVSDIARRLRAVGAAFPQQSRVLIAGYARKAGIPGRPGHATVTVPIPDRYLSHPERRVWSAPLAFKSLAVRVSLMFSERPHTIAESRVLSTEEMVVDGVRQGVGQQAEFAVHVAGPLSLPPADLPVDPYVLGAWLGDGSSSGAQIAQGESEACTDEHGLTDQEFLIEQLVNAGIDASASTSSSVVINTRGLMTKLRTAGVLGNKHIPMAYLRASADQRLSLLQGLMDTDGTIDIDGSCELCLCDEQLITGALELIRSLGIKASLSSGPAVLTEPDPERPGHKRRRVTGTRWRVNFTTTMPVFRLPRKLARLPEKVRETQQWIYIDDIVPVPTQPARCITVDSPDHTYLVKGFIPTHNTVTMLYLADQFARTKNARGERTPVVIVDPKTGSTHDSAVMASGGHVQSLDELTKSDGVFDPIRFAIRKEVGVEMAATMLLAINPFGGEKLNYETPLMHALSYGVNRGADCIGVALQHALDAGVAPKEMVSRVFDLANASPMFRACAGMSQGGTSLRTAEGITLIKVGDSHLDLPEPGSTDETTQPQRIALALVRMIVFGSAMALTGRQGVLMLDEAWVMLSAGRSEVERLGRLARSQQVLPMLWTQRITDATNAGLSGYISRGLILPIQDPDEARAACSLFRLEPTPERMARITAKGTIGGNSDQTGGAPNWGSMRALRDRDTGKVLRGAVGIYVDLAGRAVPTEIRVPQSFFDRASTNPEDIRRRQTIEAREPTEAIDPVENVDAVFGGS